ncbi:hypothetical protein F5J12DRAFT_713856 [Pisolithus orientalis]|uniref:uncharacterized protein n=1 Tax=Pisolithus orientalis TaxID=936130 RepID=UPI0022248AA9|nr:uncharacterized protein F5J12DRAFT_713856 [Pisolithus orientalis]KAI6030730.1 hypothetical protein F5J12DRAFT_713856 [Pisolithus orientalis]
MDVDSRPAQPEPSTSASLVDTASSLRAAALLSRKRRKVAATEASPRRAPEPSLQLDYGQEDSSMSTSGYAIPLAGTKGPPNTTSTTKKTPDTEQDGQREEGEISDTETSPAPTETLPPSHTPSLRDSDTISPSEPGPSWQDAHHLAANEPFVLETPTYRLDSSHVRPGLTITQQEYDTAKDLVLDLLGWGVPPEYLLEYGISRHMIYYVFTELNLRLPDNLDTSDLVPYPTPEMLVAFSVSQSSPTTPWSFRSSSSAAAMPPPPIVPVRDFLMENVADRTEDSLMLSPNRSPIEIKAEPSSPSPIDLSLHAIERQRRQELLARKAAIASRRARQGDLEVAISPSGKVLGLAAVPSQSVDEFLKTIESSHPENSDKGERSSPHPSQKVRSSESMDVDEPIPGLTGDPADDSTPSTSSRTAQTASPAMPDSITQTEPNLPAVVPPGSSSDALRNTASRLGLPSLTPSADTVDDPPALLRQRLSIDSDEANSHRRGFKRPVAADFVDNDSGSSSRNHGNSSSNGYANGSGSQLLKRKTGSFAGVNMRRCVIELSDSEDDGDGRLRAQAIHPNGREYSPAVVAAPVHYSSRPRTTTTPPIASSSGSAQSAGLTAPPPSALLEKEEEIKKMRQLIAEREEMRLRKLAVSTPVVQQPANTSTPPARQNPSKQDDTSSTSLRSRDPSSCSLDPETQLPISNVTSTARGSYTSDFSETSRQWLL